MGACASKPKTVEGKVPQEEAPVQQTPKVAPDTTTVVSTDQVSKHKYRAMHVYDFRLLDLDEIDVAADTCVGCG
jgi:hypothetical protein